jgi:hypothetical protein
LQKKILALSLFLLVAIFQAYLKFEYHECWKDEWQAWFVAKDMSWFEMFDFLSYEGHPIIWYAWLKIGQFFTGLFSLSEVLQLKILHFLPWLAVLYVLLFKMRFPSWMAGLIAISFFPFFEYGLVSRGYVFVMLFSFLLAYFEKEIGANWKVEAGLLFLICQTEVFGAFFALAWLWYKGAGKNGLPDFKVLKTSPYFKNLAWAVGIGWAFLIFSIFPETQTNNYGAAVVANPFDPIHLGTALQGVFGNSFFVGWMEDTASAGVSGLGILLSFAAIGLIVFLFFNNKKALTTWLFFMLMMFSFSVLVYQGGIRHWGMSLVFFFMLLSVAQPENWLKAPLKLAAFGVILAAQLSYAYLAVVREVKFPYTNAKETASFLKEKVPASVPIIAMNKFAGTPVVGYLGRKMYSLPDGEAFSYFRWLDKVYLPVEIEFKQFADFKNVGGLILLSGKPLPQERYPSIKPWQTFDRFNLRMENYYLYVFDVKDFEANH